MKKQYVLNVPQRLFCTRKKHSTWKLEFLLRCLEWMRLYLKAADTVRPSRGIATHWECFSTEPALLWEVYKAISIPLTHIKDQYHVAGNRIDFINWFFGGGILRYWFFLFYVFVLSYGIGYGENEWGAPPQDEFGRPLYGDVFGTVKKDDMGQSWPRETNIFPSPFLFFFHSCVFEQYLHAQ